VQGHNNMQTATQLNTTINLLFPEDTCAVSTRNKD